jgi:hypothetical protein
MIADPPAQAKQRETSTSGLTVPDQGANQLTKILASQLPN